jgi:UDP-N-acetylmuramyl pentapeptide phosphotransferase/UDP-N-acetylglucosamine-1-phosphate transferase
MGPGGTLIVALVLGVVGGALAWAMMQETFAAPLFQRTNVRGADVPVGVGVLLPVVLVGAAALLVLGERLEWLTLHDGALRTAVAAATGFGVLGLLDDLGGDASSKGFAGHLRALGRRRLTTGAVKLFGGGAVAVLVASAGSDERPGRLLADAALIALAANLANLLDRAPGRVAKVVLLAAVPVALAAGVDDRLVGPAVVLGATLALLWPDLREELMLGDTGANVLGATLGLSVVLTTAASTRTVVLIAVLALNLLSERVSFSRVIDRTPPLRAFDRLGRRP